MGILEEQSKKRTRKVRLEKIILGTLATGGVLISALLAPNILKILKDADPEWVRKRDPRRRVRETVSRLKHKGLVEFRFEEGKQRLRLTAKGKRLTSSIWSERFVLKKPKHWDGKWRLVIFDIAEKRRSIRDKIRHLVFRLGFLRLQDSVWVYPYDCEELVTLLKTDLRIGREVLYVIADVIEFDKPLRSHFDLPLD
ncbi:MAG: hypothetical protein Q8P58_00400 [Candidatus Adlerbacteria bacterium]|nr:hypothetical protein [Candidatus Adlerbacteria bacterium]